MQPKCLEVYNDGGVQGYFHLAPDGNYFLTCDFLHCKIVQTSRYEIPLIKIYGANNINKCTCQKKTPLELELPLSPYQYTHIHIGSLFYN